MFRSVSSDRYATARPEPGVHGLEPNATVVEEIDAAGFRDYITDLLATATTPARPIQGLPD